MHAITITSGKIVLHAMLNDTVASRDLFGRLPLTVGGYDSGIDYCCTLDSGAFDPAEMQTGWKNGDISLGGGWFALLYGGQEQSSAYRDMMIVGRIDDADLKLVKSLPKKAMFSIAPAEES